jgi:TonB family protein
MKPFLFLLFLFFTSTTCLHAQELYRKEKRGKWGYVDSNVKWVIDNQFEDARSFSKGRAAVKMNGLWGFIDERGKVVVPLQFEGIGDFNHSAAYLKQNGKFGLISQEGTILVEPAYDSLAMINDAVIFLESGKWGIMDTLGKQVVAPIYQRVEAGWKGCLNVKKDGQWATWVNGVETPTPLSDLVFKNADEKPRFPGCEGRGLSKEALQKCAEEEMLRFLYSRMRYPVEARNNGVDGMVVVSFTINSSGNLENMEVVRDVGAGLGTEAQRVIESMPPWIPGTVDGTAVGTRFNLPVKFKLQ